MLKDIINVRCLVKDLIEKRPELYENDTLLYLEVLNSIYSLKHIIEPKSYMTLRKIMLQAPPFESISRARRKISEKNKWKLEEEQKVREYMRN